MDFKLDEFYEEIELMKCRLMEMQNIIEKSKKEEKKKENKKTIVFDFDGVIHTGYEGYKDGSIYGKIDEELILYIWNLMNVEGYYVVISSNRSAQQIVDFMNQWCWDNDINLEFEVFNKDLGDNMYWTKDGVIGVTNQKPVGVMYIDDRGYRYRGLEDLKEYIEVFGVDLK